MKKFLALLLLPLCFLLCACANASVKDAENTGTFYTLQEAYDLQLLSIENLQTIAYYHNSGTLYPESLSKSIADSIKREWTKIQEEKDNRPLEKVDGETATIVEYYGTYADSVVVIVDSAGAMYPAVYNPITIEVGGVRFNYSYPTPQIVVWKR